MWKISQIICLGILIGMSVTDLKCRKVSGEILAVAAIGAVVFQIFCGRGNIWLSGGGMAVGLCFIGISKLTGEGMGYGDSIAILILGIYLGIWELLVVLAGAFVFLMIAAMCTLVRHKMSASCTLPFFPFLTCGYMIFLLGERSL